MVSQLHTLDTIPVEQTTQYPMNWSLGGPQVQCEYSREEKYLVSLPGIELQFI
jgi:hypothetical protein